MNYSIDPYGNFFKTSNLYSNPNPNGLLGLRGSQGVMGKQGPRGDQGPRGPDGPIGPRGAQGLDGPRGDQGDVGPKGQTGPPGDNGLNGRQGPIGLKGQQGNKGPAGPDVKQLIDTAQGLRGDPASYARIIKGDCYWLNDGSKQFTNVCLPNFAVSGMVYTGGNNNVNVKCCHLELFKPN
jgi:hypothetical protein